jgi:hypothetical protein
MLRSRPIKDYFETLIYDPNELEEFALWAFGDGLYDIVGSINFLKAWNGLHGEKLKMEPSSLIVETAPKMIKLWRDSLA